ncbi:MAG: radical SAM protein [Candidatus Omnitrophica bacterium]|nr:radical SAM protein [Candidatus Omnitrophota bacterium]
MNKLDRVMVNITWKCNLGNCSYCWHHVSSGSLHVADGSVRVAPDLNVEQWLEIFHKMDPAIIDFVGGEPFVYDDFIALCEKLPNKHTYALTTNLMSDRIEEFTTKIKPDNWIIINGSYHKNSGLSVEEFAKIILKFQGAGFPVAVNIINHVSYENMLNDWEKFLKSKGLKVFISPYEDPFSLQSRRTPATLVCKAGITHYVINNNGDVHRCLSWFRYLIGLSKKEDGKICIYDKRGYMGNLLKETFAKVKREKSCELYCDLKYLISPENSLISDVNIREKSLWGWIKRPIVKRKK